MRKLLLGTVIAAIAVTNASAQQKIKFEEYNLDNGLHVILHQDNTTPIVAVTILYHVGSKDENPERTGFAHFFEHLLFEGSENIKRGEFDKYVKNAGGELNANTSQDRTFYYEILPSNQLELGLWLESERLLHAKVEDVGIETQREVVKEEKRQRVDNQPYGTFMENVFVRAFQKHPYNWVPIGSMDHLNAAKKEEFVAFYKKYYVPNNATLSIAGDIDIETAKVLIKKYFGDIPRGADVPRVSVQEPPMTKEIRAVIPDNIQIPAMVQAYRTPNQKHQDQYALQMLSQVLSGGQSARYNQVLVDEKQIALQAFAFAYGLEDAGLFMNMAFAGLGKKIEDVEAAMDEQIKRVQNELITDQEFEKIRNQMEVNFLTGNRTMASIAESLANYYVYYGDANLINTEIERYMKVTKEDIQRVAKQYLTKENRVVLYYVPKGDN